MIVSPSSVVSVVNKISILLTIPSSSPIFMRSPTRKTLFNMMINPLAKFDIVVFIAMPAARVRALNAVIIDDTSNIFRIINVIMIKTTLKDTFNIDRVNDTMPAFNLDLFIALAVILIVKFTKNQPNIKMITAKMYL